MTPGVRVIRFARAEPSTRPGSSGPVSVSRVLLDEGPSAGQIVQHDQTWTYLLADGTSSGLKSSVSRQDLERQIILYHLGPLPAVAASDDKPPLKIAM